MKFRVSFKMPDALDNSMEQAVDHLSNRTTIEDKMDEMKTLADKYVKHGEAITVEFDTLENTCRVLKSNE